MSETGKDKLGWERIRCPECGLETKSEEWKECEPYCEDCGNHDGLRCPNSECEEQFDHVWGFDKLINPAQSKSTKQERQNSEN